MNVLRILALTFPLFLTAETITVKTKAPQNRNAVFQYRVPKGYDKNRREMYRVLVIFGGRGVSRQLRQKPDETPRWHHPLANLLQIKENRNLKFALPMLCYIDGV